MPLDTNENNALAQKIADIVKFYCSFAGPIMKTQCKRLSKTPATITLEDLDALAPLVGKSVENFTNPAKGKAVCDEILNLKNF